MKLRRPPKATPSLYSQDGKGYEAKVYAHYFVGGCDWFVTEYDPAEDIAFGWACLGDRQNAELGYVSIAELETVRVGGAFPVDYETGWQPITLTEAIARMDGRQTPPARP